MSSSPPFEDEEEFISEIDEKIIENLQTKEPAILDEAVEYHLGTVGCAVTDGVVLRLASVAAQMAFEKILQEARIMASRKNKSEGNQKPVTDLDTQSFCDAFAKNDDAFIGPNLDLFLEIPQPTDSHHSVSTPASSFTPAPSTSAQNNSSSISVSFASTSITTTEAGI